MKKLGLLLFVAALLVMSQSAFAGGQSEGGEGGEVEPITLKYAHVGVEGEVLTQFADELAKRVEEETEGRVVLEVYGNSALGNIDEMINGVKNGTIDMAMHDFASLARFVPNLAVFNAPFIYKDAAHSMRVTDPYSSNVMLQLNEELIDTAGIRIWGNCYRGARQLTANFPVYSPADVEGEKIRGVPLPIWMSMLEGMGAIPTPVEYSELATALATGVVVGQENPLNNIYNGKLYEVQDYTMMTSHMQAIQTQFINEESWQSISADDRAIMERIVVELGNESVDWTLSARDGYRAKLEEAGMTFISQDDGLDIDAFQTAVLAQVEVDFPEWTGLIAEIKQIP